MWECSEYRPTVRINLDNGAYIFLSESAIGKTYLLNTLIKISDFGVNVNGYTYHDKLQGRSVNDMFNSSKEVLLLDRVDLYAEDIDWNKLSYYSKSSIVLMDYKSGWHECISDIATVEFDSEIIEVY